MAPPSGLFVIARVDGDAVGCGGFKRVGETTAGSSGSGPRRPPGDWALRGGCAGAGCRSREAGVKTLRLDTNRALIEAHALYPPARVTGEIDRFNENPYADHWFEKRLWSLQFACRLSHPAPVATRS